MSSFYSKAKHYFGSPVSSEYHLELERFLEAGSKIRLAILSNLLIGSLALLISWKNFPYSILAGWTTLLIISIVPRVYIALNYQKVKPGTLNRWKSYFIAASLFSGIVWGVGAIAIELYGGQSNKGIEGFVLGGLSAGAIGLNSLIRWNYEAFMIPMLSCLVFWYTYQWDGVHLFMAIMVVIFMLLMSFLSSSFRKLQFEKQIMLHEAEESLKTLHLSQQRLENITNSMGEGVLVLDSKGAPNFINPKGERLLGWNIQELKESSYDICNMVYMLENNDEEECLVKRALLSGETLHSDNQQFKHRDGTIFPVSLNITPINEDDKTKNCGVVVVFQDISSQKEMENKLKKLALHDALTGLYNRGHFDKKLQDELNRAIRYDRSLSLLMIDIDFFKKVNDTYGHQAGDEALKSIANIVTSLIRNSDYAARYGGEEFIVILPETDTSKAIKLAQRMRVAVEKKEFVISQNDTIHLTVSIGVGNSANAISPKLLIEAADKALYKAKENGRNQVRFD